MKKMRDWKQTTLGEICSLISRGITPSYVSESSCYVLNQRCIRNGKVSYENKRYHNMIKKKVSLEKKIIRTDTLICSTGVGTLGRVGRFYENTKDLTTADSHVMIVRPVDTIYPLYLSYALISCQDKIEALAEGTTGQTELSRIKLADLELNLPPLSEQKAIASVLGALDDKIELNNRINANLEAQAQAIFKSWFVDFEPWGGVMPDDWRFIKIKDCGDIVCGKTPSTNSKENYGNDILFVTIPDMHNKIW